MRHHVFENGKDNIILIGTTELLYVTFLIRDNRCDGIHTHTLTFVH